MRPDEIKDKEGEQAQENSRDRRGGGAQFGPAGITRLAGEESLGQLAQGFAKSGIARLHHD